MNTLRLAAAAAILFVAAGTRAEAVIPVSPSLPSLAPAVERVTNVCGTNGCAQVQTRRVQKHSIVAKKIGNNSKN